MQAAARAERHKVARRKHGTREDFARAQRRLSYDEAQEIRRRYARGETQMGLAEMFDVSQSLVSNVVLGKGCYAYEEARDVVGLAA
jgi:DNA-directed RNA polymerase specialized sigma24 family protein